MSRFWIYLKTNLRADLKQIHLIIGMFLLLPLFFTLLMGFSFGSGFVPEATIEPIEISLQNDDEGELGGLLFDTLSSGPMEEYIEVVEEDADFHLQIHSDYSENIEDTRVTIETKENSSSEENMLQQLIMEWQQTLLDSEQLSAQLASIESPQVIQNLQNELQHIMDMNLDTIFKTEQYDSQTALTSNQFTSVTGIMYLLFMTLAGGVGMSTNKDLQGVRKRLGVIPLSPKSTILYEVGANTITYTLIILFYILLWRLIDSNTFVGNPLYYLIWIIVYTLFFQSLNAALLHIVPDKLSNVFYQILFMFYMIFGFLPIDKLVGGRIGEFFSQNFIRRIFNQPFYDHMLTGNLTGNSLILMGLVLVSILITIFTVRVKQRRELQII